MTKHIAQKMLFGEMWNITQGSFPRKSLPSFEKVSQIATLLAEISHTSCLPQAEFIFENPSQNYSAISEKYSHNLLFGNF